MEKKWDSKEMGWIIGLLVLAALLLLSRGLVWLIPTVIVPGLLILLGIYLWKNRSGETRAESTANAELTLLQTNCQEELGRLDAKWQVISRAQRELKEKIKPANSNLDPALKAETSKLLAAYTKQAEVVQAKQEFYQDMNERILALMENHEWKLQLKLKKDQLDKLRGEHYEDVEKMELLKQDLAFSTGFYQAIKELSADIAESTSATDISQMQKELHRLFPK